MIEAARVTAVSGLTLAPAPAPTVLVVDDDPVFRSLARDMLADSGLSVVEAADGLDAFRYCRDRAPSLLVVDAVMPKMDGFALCRELRSRRETRFIPILMVTGMQDRAALDQAYHAGATGFVMKPVEWQSFSQRVRYMLRNAEAMTGLCGDAGGTDDPASNRSPSVLIVDDDPLIRELTRDALEDEGYALAEAEDGGAACDFCRTAVPDLIIADIVMPRMDGFELCRRLRREPKTASVPILMATGLDDYQSIATAFDVGATDFIAKPLNWLILKYRVRYMLRAARTFTHLLAEKQRAETADRAKSALIANMSHELRTPLNAVIGFSEIMSGQVLGPLSPQYAEYAKIIGHSGSHLLGLINDLLDVAKAEVQGATLADEAVPLPDIVAFGVGIVEGMARKADITCSVRIEDGLPAFRGDGKKLQQVLINLLANAIKFTPAGGAVTLSAAREAQAGGLVLQIADTGVGIPRDKIAVALAPFGQIDSPLARKNDGVGLGLPLTKRLVELHDGTLTIDSEPGAGTTVTLRFPPERFVAANLPTLNLGNVRSDGISG